MKEGSGVKGTEIIGIVEKEEAPKSIENCRSTMNYLEEAGPLPHKEQAPQSPGGINKARLTPIQENMKQSLLHWRREYKAHCSSLCTDLIAKNNQLLQHIYGKRQKPNKGQFTWGKSISPILLPARESRKPKGSSYIPISKSLRREDERNLEFMPELTYPELQTLFQYKIGDLRALFNLQSIEKYSSVSQYIRPAEVTDYLFTMYLRKYGVQTDRLEDLAYILGKNPEVLMEYFVGILERERSRKQRKEKGEAPEENSREREISKLGMYHKRLFCNKCFIYNCHFHKKSLSYLESNSLSLNVVNDKPALRLTAQRGEIKLSKAKKYCSNFNLLKKDETMWCEAAKCIGPDRAKSCIKGQGEELDEKSTLSLREHKLLFEVLRLGVYNPCFLCYMINSYKCKSVELFLKENSYMLNPQGLNTIFYPLDVFKELQKNVFYYNVPSAKSVFRPCSHKGPCTPDNGCDCFKRGFCEKYCICKGFCERQYPGCYCKRGMCLDKKCKCFANNRECDPDLCKCCYNYDLMTLYRRFTTNSITHKCSNLSMTLNIKKKAYMGASLLCDGFGLFAGKDFSKNEFIAEYKGEIISTAEGERRGLFYDIRGVTYLFTLNDEFMIDALNYGNKLRLANHGAHGQENAHAKVIFVAGDSRIGLYASRNIDAGSEILFDYHMKRQFKWVKEYNDRVALEQNTNKINLMQENHNLASFEFDADQSTRNFKRFTKN